MLPHSKKKVDPTEDNQSVAGVHISNNNDNMENISWHHLDGGGNVLVSFWDVSFCDPAK